MKIYYLVKNKYKFFISIFVILSVIIPNMSGYSSEDLSKLDLLYQAVIERYCFDIEINNFLIIDSTMVFKKKFNLKFRKLKEKAFIKEFIRINISSDSTYKFKDFIKNSSITDSTYELNKYIDVKLKWISLASFASNINTCVDDSTVKNDSAIIENPLIWENKSNRWFYCYKRCFPNIVGLVIFSKPLIKGDIAILRVSEYQHQLSAQDIVFLLKFIDNKWEIIDFQEISVS